LEGKQATIKKPARPALIHPANLCCSAYRQPQTAAGTIVRQPESHRKQTNDQRSTLKTAPMPMKVRKAVFPAAGLGTRFLPATKAQPKEMLPLVDKPIIQYGVEEAMASGCDQILIITGRGKQAIEDHFDVSYELERMLEDRKKLDLLKIVRSISDMMHVAYVRQKEALGLGHAVLMARELVGDEPFAVLLADDVIDAKVPCLKQMVEVFDQTQCSVLATQIIEGKMISSYGVLDVKPVEQTRFGERLYEIKNMVEKPKPEDAPSNLAIIGRYILTPAIFECLAKTPTGAGGELQLTDGMRLLLQKEKMYAYVYEGRRHDTGDKLGFLKATVEFALKREDLGQPFREYLKGLKL
jgi:UTP--glucose-1-phosphate uridylyltransferase